MPRPLPRDRWLAEAAGRFAALDTWRHDQLKPMRPIDEVRRIGSAMAARGRPVMDASLAGHRAIFAATASHIGPVERDLTGTLMGASNAGQDEANGRDREAPPSAPSLAAAAWAAMGRSG